MTASWQKIFSADPKIGYWANHQAFVDARDAGMTSFGSATNVAQIDAVIRNTFIQTGLSILFAILVPIVFITGVVVSIKALRAGGLPTSEEPDKPSGSSLRRPSSRRLRSGRCWPSGRRLARPDASGSASRMTGAEQLVRAARAVRWYVEASSVPTPTSATWSTSNGSTRASRR